MARQRVIVGIGEALLCEYPDRLAPGGLAVLCATHAARLGHVGVAVSRIGQDPAAEELLRQLKTAHINVDHIQSDPDLATGRMTVRSIAGRTSQALTSRAAFDNLQWDFDLVDVAQQADAVVFGSLARREGLSRSIIKRFLAECGHALRVFDTTNRATGDVVDRAEVRTGLEFAEGLIADGAALRALVPAWDGSDARSAALEIMRESNVSFVLSVNRIEGGDALALHGEERSVAGSRAAPANQREATIVGLVHALLNGDDLVRSLEFALEAAEHAAKHPHEPMALGS